VGILQHSVEDKQHAFIWTPTGTRGTEDEERALLLAQRQEEFAAAEARYTEFSQRFAALNVALRAQTKERVDFIVKEASADAVQLAQLWEEREKYRVYVEQQNASLNYLLKRAADAKVVARAAEKKAADEAAALAEKLRKEEEKKNAKKK
jgi:hypothetical protein